MKRLLTVTGALIATAAASALVAPAAFADAPVNGAAEKSLVQVEVDFAGLVGKPSLLGGFRWDSTPTIVSQACTGFFVTGQGHIATAGHCVDPREAREALITQYLDDQVTAGELSPSQAADALPEALATWNVQGPTPGSEVQRRIEVTQPDEVEGAILHKAQPARLMDFETVDAGDLALLKVERTGTPALPIGDTDPQAGDTVTAAGFPGAVRQVSDPDLVRPSFKSGTVSSNQVSRGGVAQTEIDADLAPGMSGGPTFDRSGVVVGVNSFILKGQQSFNFITDTTDLRDWLATQGLTTPSHAPAGADPSGLLVDGSDVQHSAFSTPEGSVTSPWLLAGVLGGIAVVATGAGVVRARRRTATQGGGSTPTGPFPTGPGAPAGFATMPPAGGPAADPARFVPAAHTRTPARPDARYAPFAAGRAPHGAPGPVRVADTDPAHPVHPAPRRGGDARDNRTVVLFRP